MENKKCSKPPTSHLFDGLIMANCPDNHVKILQAMAAKFAETDSIWPWPPNLIESS